MIYTIEMQDDTGNVLYPHASAAKTWLEDGVSVKDVLGILSDYDDYTSSESTVPDIDSILSTMVQSNTVMKNLSGAKALAKLFKSHSEDTAIHTGTQPYQAGSGLDLTNNIFTNTGVVSIQTGTSNGTIQVKTGSITADVSVYGLGTAAYESSSSFASSGHSHNYAASSSVGGSAISAEKLSNTSAIGSATNPVYFDANGVPVATSYTLGKSVPSDAKFTDTTYVNMIGATSSDAGVVGLVPAPAAGAATRYLRSDGTWQVPPDTNTTYAAATTDTDGLMTSDMVTKLNGIAAGANEYSLPTATSSALGGVKTGSNITNTSGTISLTKDNVTGALGYTPPTTDTTYAIATTGTDGLMTSDMVTKLNGIAAGAQVNTVTGVKGNNESTYRTGDINITAANIGLGNVENKTSATIREEITSSNVTTALGFTPLNNSLKGSKNGLAELDENGFVPSSQLPSYVDGTVEGYLYNGVFYKESSHTTALTGEAGKIYVDLENSSNKIYRWTGSIYAVISDTITLGTTSATAFRGDYGNTAYTHSQKTSGNPHNVTKTDVGLGNVDNTADNTKVVSAAAKLTNTSAIGSATNPVYFDANGVPVATSYTLSKSVPSNAVFTDTTYSDMTAASSSTAGTHGLVPAPAAGKQAQFLRGDGTWATPTNTTYAAATTSANGLMTAADKTKLNGIAGNGIVVIPLGSTIATSERTSGAIYFQITS